MDDHFEIKLIARLLDQMYVVQAPVFLLRYDDAPPSAPQFPEHLQSLLTCLINRRCDYMAKIHYI